MNVNGTVTSVAEISPNVGQYPSGPLVREESGDFLGVLSVGPVDPLTGTHQNGSIFRVTPGGAISLVVDPSSSSSGLQVGTRPVALTPEGSGGYISAMQSGGSNGTGGLFRITPAGEFIHITALPGATPTQPCGTPVMDSAGNLYGTTRYGGPSGEGTVFKLTLGGSYTTVGGSPA